jgi:hypothetical protein
LRKLSITARISGAVRALDPQGGWRAKKIIARGGRGMGLLVASPSLASSIRSQTQ